MVYLFGPFQLDASLPLLLREGETVAVPPRALAGLALLVQRRHTAVSKRELMDALWPDSFVEEGSLAQVISVLRKVLSAGFADGSPIQTIPKVGYRFTAEVTEASTPVQDQVALAASPATEAQWAPAVVPVLPLAEAPIFPVLQPAAGHKRLWVAALVAGFLLLVVAAVFGNKYVRHRRFSSRVVDVSSGRYSVAVLPFKNLSASPDAAWVGIAAQEMLATDLRLSRGLRVLPSEDVNRALQEVQWADSADPGPATMRRLAPDLDCEHVVTGAYLLQGGRIRLDVRVVSLLNGVTEQESTFEQPANDLLPMLAEVSSRTARGLGMVADGTDQARALAAGVSPAAYKLFAQGIARNRVYDFKGAIDLLQQSIALDANFPPAHEELSKAWSARGQEKQAIAEAERAMQLSVNLPREQQLSTQARMQSAKHQFVEAANTYRALFSFFPDNREYGRLLIQSLSSAGRSDQALAESQKLLASSNPATARDPLLFSVIADMYSTLGNWPSSLEWAKRGADESKRRGATILYERLLTTESQANLHMGRYAVAEAQTREALTLARQYHDVSGELRALNRLGEIATAQKDWTAAESALLAAVDLEHTYDQSQREAHTLLTLSRLNQSRGDLPKAVAYGTKATDLAKKLGFADLTTEARLQMAVVNGAMGHRASATTQLIEVRAEAEQIHDAYLQQQAQDALNGLKVH